MTAETAVGDGGAKGAGGVQRLDPSVYKVAAVATFGSLLAQLDATIINVSLSSLAADLHSTLPTIQWVTSGYLLALTFVLPLNGWLVGRIGGKALYLWCFALFTLTSALCGLAWSAGSLIGFRLLQGLSGGLLAPMSQLMIKRAAGPNFTRIAGYASLPVLLGPLLGPVIAGAILTYASWRWLFLVNVPVGLLGLGLALVFLPNDKEEREVRQLDWVGLLLLSPALALVLFGWEQIRQPLGVAAATVGLLMLAVFLRVETRLGDKALIDLKLFRRRAFSAASTTQFLWNGVLFAGQMLIPLFLIQACGRSPAEIGWILAPLGLGMMVTVPSLGFLTRRFSERTVAIFGAGLSFMATAALVWMAVEGLNLLVLAPLLFLRGVGQGAVALPTVSAAYAAVDRRTLPMATTTLNIVQRLGGPALTTLCAVVLEGMLGARLAVFGLNAWALALLLLSSLHALMVVSTVLLPALSPRASAAPSGRTPQPDSKPLPSGFAPIPGKSDL